MPTTTWGGPIALSSVFSPVDGGGDRVTEGLARTAVKDSGEHGQRCCRGGSGGSVSSSLCYQDNALLLFAGHGTGAPLRFLKSAEELPLMGSGRVLSQLLTEEVLMSELQRGGSAFLISWRAVLTVQLRV